jgi:hypothetical protein
LKENGDYEGKLKIVIYDHFGLDNEDVKPGSDGSRFDGFYYWFMLQRWEGFHKEFKPFVTVINKELHFKGNYRKVCRE